jgi:hypothetical protein
MVSLSAGWGTPMLLGIRQNPQSSYDSFYVRFLPVLYGLTLRFSDFIPVLKTDCIFLPCFLQQTLSSWILPKGLHHNGNQIRLGHKDDYKPHINAQASQPLTKSGENSFHYWRDSAVSYPVLKSRSGQMGKNFTKSYVVVHTRFRSFISRDGSGISW